MPLGIPSFPCPARPPIPRISPSLTSRFTLRTVSPGISTQSFSTERIVFPFEVSRTSRSALLLSTLRPTIHLVISATFVSEAADSLTTYPSRMTTTRSHTARISCRRCVIKMIAIPRLAIPRIDSSRASASFSVKTAVGSSRIRSLSCSFDSSLAISVNCLCPTGISLIIIFRSISTPISSMAFAAR